MENKLKKLEEQLEGASSILNEWVEKGYALVLLWTFSTRIHICPKNEIRKEINEVVKEIKLIEKQSVRARAYQQGIWIEEVKDPFYVFYAEALGLFHPKVLQVYKEYPLLQKFAEEIEEWFNARLAKPIMRVGYKEESSTAIAEALAAFLRQVEAIERIPREKEVKIKIGRIKKPVYFGYIQVRSGKGFEDTKQLFMIDLNELRKHCLITGATGSGKTRIAQLIAETSCLHIPTLIIDPMGEFTGMIKENRETREFKRFKLRKPIAYKFAKIFTLDDIGIKFKANLLKNPGLEGDTLIADADQTALVLSELIEDVRLRDDIRETLLEAWREGRDLSYEGFIENLKARAERRRIAVKIDRLAQFKPLMEETYFSIQDLLREKLVIFDLSSMLFNDKQKLMIIWFILREILNYYLA